MKGVARARFAAPIAQLLHCVACALALAAVHGPASAAQTAGPGALYETRCAQCHGAGAGGAPRVTDTAEWVRRSRSGLRLLYASAIDGMPNSAMAAKGGHRDLTEAEVRAAVDHMLERAALPASARAAAIKYDALGITSRAFVRLDRNFDGLLSRDEVAGDEVLVGAFARFDVDRDGRLSEAEYLRLEEAAVRERASVKVDDDQIRAAVLAALKRVPRMPGTGIQVAVKDGGVTLSGVVEEGELARRADDALRRIAGMVRLDNRLVPGSLLEFD